MILSGIIFEDFVNYKKPSMTLMFPYCTMKCNTEAGCKVCHNQEMLNYQTLDVDIQSLIDRYLSNPISEAVVFQGLEPFDSFEDMLEFIVLFRIHSNDDIVIYTGYYKEEINDKLDKIKTYNNIIVKFGRYLPDQEKYLDPVLGIYLVSDNQYAERIS